MVEGVVGGGLGVVALLALGRAEVVASGIGPWVVVVGVLVGHGDGVVERSRSGGLGYLCFRYAWNRYWALWWYRRWLVGVEVLLSSLNVFAW